MSYDPCDYVWQLADFCVRETYALRSFLRYLREGEDTPEVKEGRLQGWRSEVATSLGNPLTSIRAESVVNTIRNLPPLEQREPLQKLLAQMSSFYFGDSS
jgi:hypothetical protein